MLDFCWKWRDRSQSLLVFLNLRLLLLAWLIFSSNVGSRVSCCRGHLLLYFTVGCWCLLCNIGGWLDGDIKIGTIRVMGFLTETRLRLDFRFLSSLKSGLSSLDRVLGRKRCSWCRFRGLVSFCIHSHLWLVLYLDEAIITFSSIRKLMNNQFILTCWVAETD